MVREITFFEVHLDGARFGTNDSVVDDQPQERTEESGDGPSIGRLVVVSLFLSIVLSMLVRRLLGEEDGDDDGEEADEPINVEIES